MRNPIKSIDELCQLTGMDKLRMKRILEMGIEMGTIKKISETEYEMTDNGLDIGSRIIGRNFQALSTGTWKCTKCSTINNALNGEKCLKCSYTYIDSIASDLLNREPKEYKFPKITDREMLVFLIGHITGMASGFEIPGNISFAQKMEYQNHISTILSKLTSEIVDQFPHVSNDEFHEILYQVNALRTLPFLDEAMKKIRDVK